MNVCVYARARMCVCSGGIERANGQPQGYMLLKTRLHKFRLIIHNNNPPFVGCLFIPHSLTCQPHGAHTAKRLRSGSEQK